MKPEISLYMILNKLSLRSQNMLRAIRSLPLHIGYDMELIESYVTDRRAVHTEKQLKAFTRHWNSVWKIPWNKIWVPTRQEIQLVSGRYNASNAIRCISKNGSFGHGCCHLVSNRHCISADIMAPSFLLHVLKIKEAFIVPEGVIILQLIKALHDDLRDKDQEDIIMYLNEHRPTFRY